MPVLGLGLLAGTVRSGAAWFGLARLEKGSSRRPLFHARGAEVRPEILARTHGVLVVKVAL